MRTRRLFYAALASGLLTVAGCRADPIAAPPAPLAGDWSGAIVDSASGSGTAHLTMVQTGNGLAGSWATTFADVDRDDSGSLDGSIAGTSVSIFLTPKQPVACATGALTGTLGVTATLAADRLAGTYVALACRGTDTGTLSLDLAAGP